MKLLVFIGFLLVAVAAAAALSSGRARAASESCTITPAPTLSFGSFDVLSGAALSATGTIQGNCTKGPTGASVISVTLGDGLHVQGNGNRAMICTTGCGTYTTDLLQYQIYTDAAHTTVWNGTTTVTTADPCGVSSCGGGSGLPWGPINVYAAIFSPVAGGINDSAIGTYSDTVVITTNF